MVDTEKQEIAQRVREAIQRELGDRRTVGLGETIVNEADWLNTTVRLRTDNGRFRYFNVRISEVH